MSDTEPRPDAGKRLHRRAAKWPDREQLAAMSADEFDAFLASIGRGDLKVLREALTEIADGSDEPASRNIARAALSPRHIR